MPNVHSTLTSLFSDIADAIRAKTGVSGTIVADEFPDAIADIPSGGTLEYGFLTFTGTEPFTLKTYNTSKNWDGRLEYSTDAENWTVWSGTEISSANDKLYMRGFDNTRLTGGGSNYNQFNNCRFILTGSTSACRIAVAGNLLDLLDCRIVALGDQPRMGSGSFACLFNGCTLLTSAPSLPATSLGSYCCYYLFRGCTRLTAAPSLPATTLGSNCYQSMFEGCTSLVAPSELPATTLAGNCYTYMFDGCTALTSAPELPATTLKSLCYSGMFRGCIRLTTAPSLPATTLATHCYDGMFYGCTALSSLPVLPATTLETYCYNGMFRGCTSIKLSETQDATYAYAYRIPASGNGTTASYALDNMFTGTGGSFTGAPTIDTTYYTDHQPVTAGGTAA